MIYCSIDIETSGLDPLKNKVLSIGAIVEDTEKKLPYHEIPKFNAIVLQREIVGSPRAILMNQNIIQLMSDYLEGNDDVKFLLKEKSGYNFYEEDEVIKELFDFLFLNGFEYNFSLGNRFPEDLGKTGRVVNGKFLPGFSGGIKPISINVAGKNFGTFDKLFLQELPWWKKLIIPKQRILDPSVLYCDWKNDKSLPSLSECKERAGFNNVVTHNAIEDAWDIIELFRKFY